MTRKVAVVGMGHVGATVAHYLVSGGFVDDLVLFDTNEAKVNSDALDLRDAMANLPTHTNLYVNDWDQVADCDVVISALGKSKLVDTPDHDRFAEFKFTRTQVPVVGQKLKDHGFYGNLVVITNPCDVITAMYQKATGLPKHQVLGTGTLLDSARMRATVGETLHVDSRSVVGYNLGEHGNSQFSLVDGPRLRQALTGVLKATSRSQGGPGRDGRTGPAGGLHGLQGQEVYQLRSGHGGGALNGDDA